MSSPRSATALSMFATGSAGWEIVPRVRAHALAGVMRLGQRLAVEQPEAEPVIVVCLSGRGDKDVATAIEYFGLTGKPDCSTGGIA